MTTNIVLLSIAIGSQLTPTLLFPNLTALGSGRATSHERSLKSMGSMGNNVEDLDLPELA